MSTPLAILQWAKDHVREAQVQGCTLRKFVFPDDFEGYLYSRMAMDSTIMPHEFNVIPGEKFGESITTLMGIPCKFDKRLPHGKTLFLYDTGKETISGPGPSPPYPGAS